MLAWITYFSVAALETWGFFYFIDTFLDCKWKGKRKIVLVLIMYALENALALSISWFIQNDMSVVLRTLCIGFSLVVLAQCAYNSTLGQSILIGGMSIAVTTLSDSIFLWLLASGDLHVQRYIAFIGKVLGVVVLLGIRRFFGSTRESFRKIGPRWLHYGWFPLFTMALAFYVVIRFSMMGEYRWFFSVLSGTLLALNLFAMYVLKNSLESDERIRNMELLVRNKQDQLRLFQDMKFLYERQSKKTHDYKKQLYSIQELLENDETESAVSLVRSLTNSLSVDLSEVNTGHPVINAVLNQEYRMAKERGIGMFFAVEDMHDFRMDEEDIVILFGNLLENAINECSRLIGGGVTDPAIQIKLAKANDKTVLSVKNPVVSKVEIWDNETVGPLPPGHGIGLMNVREVVDKYDGDLVLSCDEREFMAVVMI